MIGLRGILSLLVVVVLIASGSLILGRDLRQQRIDAGVQLEQARQEAAILRLRLAEMAAGPGQGGPTLPALVAADVVDAELQLQDQLLSMGRAHDINPISFGSGPMPVEVSHPAVAFFFEFETAHNRAMDFIEALEQQDPAMALHGLWIRQLPVGSLGEMETPVSVRLTLWSFWKSAVEGQDG